MSETRKPRKLRWYQYSLRSLLLLMLLVSIGMSWVAVRIRQQEAVEEIEKLGGWVHYEYQAGQFDDDPLPNASPPGPAWLRHLLGENFFATVVGVRFRDPEVTDAALEYLKRLTQLHNLDLDHTHVTDAGLENLTGLTQLQSLNLGSTSVDDAGLEHLRK